MVVIPPNPIWWSGSAGAVRQTILTGGSSSLQSERLGKVESGGLFGEFHKLADIAGGGGGGCEDLTEFQGCSHGSARALADALPEWPILEMHRWLRPAVLSGAKWSGVCPEGIVLMGVCAVIERGRLNYWSSFRELLSCVKRSWQPSTALAFIALNLWVPVFSLPLSVSLSLSPFLGVWKRAIV